MNFYHVLAGVCTIGVFIFSLFATKKDSDTDKKEMQNTITRQGNELGMRQERLNILTEENKIQIARNNSLGEENKRLGTENNRLANENNTLAKQITESTDQLTSAGSFPIISVNGHGSNFLSILIALHGKYAIPNLKARIESMPDYTHFNGLDWHLAPLTTKNEDFGTLRPDDPIFYSIPFNNIEVAATFYFKSDNHDWWVHLRTKQTNKGLKSLVIVSELRNNYKFVQIDKDFPINPDNTVTFWENTKIPISTLQNVVKSLK